MYQPNTPPNDRSRSLNAGKSSVSKRPPTTSNASGLNHRVRQLPQHNLVPIWLKLLLTMQKKAVVLLASIFGLNLILYGYTVYTQDSWKHQYGQLKRLQQQEDQQSVMNEILKHQMAQTSEQPESGLVAPQPDRIVFIPRAAQRATKSLPAAEQPKTTPVSKLSVGY